MATACPAWKGCWLILKLACFCCSPSVNHPIAIVILSGNMHRMHGSLAAAVTDSESQAVGASLALGLQARWHQSIRKLYSTLAPSLMLKLAKLSLQVICKLHFTPRHVLPFFQAACPSNWMRCAMPAWQLNGWQAVCAGKGMWSSWRRQCLCRGPPGERF